jgi:hypothetical protein
MERRVFRFGEIKIGQGQLLDRIGQRIREIRERIRQRMRR